MAGASESASAKEAAQAINMAGKTFHKASEYRLTKNAD